MNEFDCITATRAIATPVSLWIAWSVGTGLGGLFGVLCGYLAGTGRSLERRQA